VATSRESANRNEGKKKEAAVELVQQRAQKYS